MSNQEFETTCTALSSAFAEAGAKLLDYQPLVSTAVADIPGTSPQKYAVAGTLKGILSMAGKMMGEAGVTGLEGLTRHSISDGNWNRTDYFKCADVERLLAAPTAVSQSTGDLTEEQIRDAVQGIYLSDFQDNPEGYDIAIARAAIAAYLAAQKKINYSEA
jgi:hypothetical protein